MTDIDEASKRLEAMRAVMMKLGTPQHTDNADAILTVLAELERLKGVGRDWASAAANAKANELAAEATAARLREALTKAEARSVEMRQWLSDEAPFTFADQKHLDANTPERAYWHHGYMMALSDLAAALKEPHQ